jgi:hypothetical protein
MNDLRKAAEMALKYFEDAHGLEDEEVAIKEALRQAIKQAEKQEPWVKTYCGGKPNYTAPVHGSDILQERVDETAKGEHKREWVGLDGEIPGLGLVTEEFYNGMIVAEDILREKNT